MQRVAFFVVFLVAYCYSHPSVGEFNKKFPTSSTKSLVFAGTWGSKQYFYGTDAKSPIDARAECESANMELVNIGSTNELEAIRKMLPASLYFWTSGLDANVFRWGNGENVDLPFLFTPL